MEETELPSQAHVYSSLNDEHITQNQYKHAKKVWKASVCTIMGDYHDLYLKTDVYLLADVFENLCLCLQHYGWIQHTTIHRRACLGTQC